MIWLLLLVTFAGPILSEYIAAIGKYDQVLSTAVIIGPRYLLTTAIFIKESRPHELWARTGSKIANKGGEVVNVEGYVLHPLYNPHKDRYEGDTRNDVAIVILVSDLTNTVNYMKLPTTANQQYGGSSALVSSWGYKFHEEYKNTTIQIKHKPDCDVTHPGINCTLNFWAYSPQCALGRGSPVVLNDQLIGIIVDPAWCQSKGDMFVNNISYYRDWIQQLMTDFNLYHY